MSQAPIEFFDPRVARLLLIGRGLRGFADGYIAVLLPAYLLALGMDQFDVGLLSTTTLAGSALATIAVGLVGHRWPQQRLLLGAALLMAATGLAFAGLSAFWPLFAVAFIGTLNPNSGDASVFLPLEQNLLAAGATADQRTRLFARYSLTGSLSAAFGALASGVPAWMAASGGLALLDALRVMFVLYALIGLTVWVIYRRLPSQTVAQVAVAPLGPSRRIVVKMTVLFGLDSFAGGLIIQSLLALWLLERFGLPLSQAGLFFFWSGLLTAGSQLVAPALARRIGLLNTMVFTHIPASICLIAAAFAPTLELTLTLLFVRSALSQLDVPTRSAFVMAVVTPPERSAAASFTAVPRSLASAIGPTIAGALLAGGALAAPLVICGVLKITYDVALLAAFKRVRLD